MQILNILVVYDIFASQATVYTPRLSPTSYMDEEILQPSLSLRRSPWSIPREYKRKADHIDTGTSQQRM
jgi:hypothetical protein